MKRSGVAEVQVLVRQTLDLNCRRDESELYSHFLVVVAFRINLCSQAARGKNKIEVIINRMMPNTAQGSFRQNNVVDIRVQLDPKVRVMHILPLLLYYCGENSHSNSVLNSALH